MDEKEKPNNNKIRPVGLFSRAVATVLVDLFSLSLRAAEGTNA